MNNSAAQLPRRHPFRNEFLYVSVVENKKTASKRQKRFPEKALGPVGNTTKCLWPCCSQEQGDQQVPVCSWGTIKPFYKLSQE